MINAKTIKARAPLRLGLAGGGTDVSPYCDQYGGLVLNATITRYAYAVINILESDAIRFVAADQGASKTQLIHLGVERDGKLELHTAVYKYMMERYNDGKNIPLELVTFCEAPVGSGLGSSSTLVVAMIKAFMELFNLPLDDYEIAHLAFQIERIDCGLQGGRQDQYSATFGGFNFMEFYENDRSVINQLRVKNWIISELESSLILFFTGVSRESAKIIADQSANVKNHDVNAIEAMHGLKQEALIMKECLIKGDFPGVVESMRMGWESKKRSAKLVSNPLIEEIYQSAMDSGALAGKVSGAGGGGFMLFFAPTESRMQVVDTLNKFKGEVSNCHFTKHGAQAWSLR